MDYKISRLTENADGTVTVVQRIYAGEVTTEDELVRNESTKELELQPVTRYRRSNVIDETEYVLEV